MCDVITNKEGLCAYCAAPQNEANGWRSDAPEKTGYYLAWFKMPFYDYLWRTVTYNKETDRWLYDGNYVTINCWQPLPSKPDL